jgi:predicted glycosyltransferase
LKIWYDACTGKHVRYGFEVGRRLRSLGHEVILTTRKHPDTLSLLNFLGADFKVVGKYTPFSPRLRLEESLKRQLAFSRMFEINPPDYAVSHGSIDLCRVAFGLGMNIISTADAPHAEAANKLALPLVNILIASKAIPLQEYRRFGVDKIIQFDGVDEVAWIRDSKSEDDNDEKPLIIVRQMETMASYAKDIPDATEEVARRLVSLGNLIFIPRYERNKRSDFSVPPGFVDTVKLTAKADLVVSAGGTISREAALQGTPSIVIQTFGRSYVNDYLSDLGFPLFTVEADEVRRVAGKKLGRKLDVREKLEQLEDPVDYIERIVQNML